MQRYYTDFMLFQFHKGTIRTASTSKILQRCSYFNSIKVQLELVKLYGTTLFVSNFNSIKVQLEQVSTKEFSLNPIFQFHKGTIRTLLVEFVHNFLRHFNSIKVQLELKRTLISLSRVLIISIP